MIRRARKSGAKKQSPKKVNKWVQFVKKMAMKNKMTYKQALQSDMVKKAYRSGKSM